MGHPGSGFLDNAGLCHTTEAMRSRWCFLLSGILISCCYVPLLGCGGTSIKQDCGIYWILTVTPSSATVDHNAKSPLNQVQFVGVARATAPPGCPRPADLERLEYASWSNPDPTDIQISSANDSTNGTAICLNATHGPVTLTGTFAPITVNGPAGGGTDKTVKSVTLTCQ